MDQNTDIGQISLGGDTNDSIAKGLMQKEQWDMPEFQDTAGNTVGDNKENRELMFNLDDIHEIEEAELPPLICKKGKSSRNKKRSDSDNEEEYAVKMDKFGAPTYGPKSAKYLNITEPKDRLLALQAALNPFHQICVWKKAVSFLRSLPVPLQHVNWKLEYNGYHKNEEDGTGQWKAEIRVTDPCGNIYNQGFSTKKTSRKMAKYHKLSDIMSPKYFKG
uniref:Uncharacterized protein n=1 Tax=Tanacetum cinerariifolium TaxID=118510 RepID=A0A6L2M7E8_TANCI|nr:hypothetical protein [Tanacetum cinerariifolium]